MYRTALRTASRPAAAGLRAHALRSAPRRFASTSPAAKSRSWKGSAVRWALAGGAVYYYSTSTVFAEEAIPVKQFSTAPPSFPEATELTQLPTVESIVEERKSQAAAKAQKSAEPTPKKPDGQEEAAADLNTAAEVSPAALEEEAGGQEAAFNPETGEINWDCPCLGGMAHGPCGEEFKTAFSCFVYSNEEPKGMECIEKFQGMQECFRQYPEIYGAELAEADDAEDLPADLELPSDTQTLREGQSGEKQTLAEDDLATEKQIGHAEPSATDAPAAPEQKTEKPAESNPTPTVAASEQKTERPAESEPAPAAIPEASIDTTSTTTTSHGPKWEDATDANKDAPKTEEA